MVCAFLNSCFLLYKYGSLSECVSWFGAIGIDKVAVLLKISMVETRDRCGAGNGQGRKQANLESKTESTV